MLLCLAATKLIVALPALLPALALRLLRKKCKSKLQKRSSGSFLFFSRLIPNKSGTPLLFFARRPVVWREVLVIISVPIPVLYSSSQIQIYFQIILLIILAVLYKAELRKLKLNR